MVRSQEGRQSILYLNCYQNNITFDDNKRFGLPGILTGLKTG
jgi:hypothetical protein